mgnify:CR=1 FL=1
MKWVAPGMLLALSVGNVQAQSYIKSIPNSNYFSLTQLVDGDLVLAGRRTDMDTTIVFSKYSLGGNHKTSKLIWTGTGISLDEAHASNLLYNDNDSLLLSAYVSDGTDGGVLGAIIKTGKDGDIAFYKRAKVGVPTANVRGGIAATFRPQQSNHYINVGWTNPGVPSAPFDYGGMVQKTDLQGNVVWSKFIKTGFQFMFAATDGADLNSYTIAGGSSFSRILNLDTSGAVNWSVSFKAGGTNTEILGIKRTSDSSYIHVGNHIRNGGTDKNAYIMKMDKDAVVVWAYSLGNTLDDEFTNVIQTADGGFIAVGKTLSYGAGLADAWVVKFSKDGVVQWAKTIGDATTDENLYNIIESKSGSFITVGKQGINSILVALKNDGTLECSDDVTPIVTNITTTTTVTPVTYVFTDYNTILTEQASTATASFDPTTQCAYSDIGIKNINIEFDPVYNCSNVPLTATLFNDGSDTVHSIVVALRVNINIVTYDTINSSIPAGDTFNFTFNSTWNPGAVGNYNVCLYVVDAIDEYALNDTVCTSITTVALAKPTIQLVNGVLSTQNIYDTYQWLLEGNAVNGATGVNFNPTLNGNYSVAVYKNGCADTSTVLNIKELSINGASSTALLNVYPIPFSDQLNINTAWTGLVEIYTIDGKLIISKNIDKETSISTAKLNAGTYILKVTNRNQESIIRKVVKF